MSQSIAAQGIIAYRRQPGMIRIEAEHTSWFASWMKQVIGVLIRETGF
jgi:hypothetical protein